MRLTFLGTGPAVGIPRPNHDDPLCKDALKPGSKSRRQRSSALVEASGVTLLIDAGPDLEAQLASAKPDHIDAVLLTHGHSDASGGIDLLNHWASRQPGTTKLPVITDRLTAERLRARYGTLGCLQWVTVSAFDTLTVGSVVITPVPVEHAFRKGFPTMGYIFDHAFAYASDVADLPAETAHRLHGIRTLVLDAAFYFKMKRLPFHLTTDESIEWGQRLDVSHLILTQTGHTYPPHDEAERAILSYLREHKIHTPHRVSLAYDGWSLNV